MTATSLMVCQPAAEVAAVLAPSMPALVVGLHVDLGEWDSVAGEWIVGYELVDQLDPDAVATEIGAQLTRFERLLGRPPSHIDPVPVRRKVLRALDGTLPSG